MNAKRTVAVALAALVVWTGAVAATPAGQAVSHADGATVEAGTDAGVGADAEAGTDAEASNESADAEVEVVAGVDRDVDADGRDDRPDAANASADAQADAAVAASSERDDVDASERPNATAAPAGAASEARSERGPPENLPAQVPDHVSEIHDTIDSFLSGDLEGSLGEALSGLLGEGGESVDAETNANANATAEAGASTTTTPATT